jgi:hypothetical protein
MHLSTAHTIKANMLRDSTHSALSSIRVALSNPEQCEIDALSAIRVAGKATTDTDATAYAHVPVIHALACAAGGALPPSPESCFPYSSLYAAFLPAVLRAVGSDGSADEKATMVSLAESVLGDKRDERSAAGLATHLDDVFSDINMPTAHGLLGCTFGLQGEHHRSRSVQEIGDSKDEHSTAISTGSAEHTAKLVALSVFNSPQVRGNGSRALPMWFDSIDKVLSIVTDALEKRCGTEPHSFK